MVTEADGLTARRRLPENTFTTGAMFEVSGGRTTDRGLAGQRPEPLSALRIAGAAMGAAIAAGNDQRLHLAGSLIWSKGFPPEGWNTKREAMGTKVDGFFFNVSSVQSW